MRKLFKWIREIFTRKTINKVESKDQNVFKIRVGDDVPEKIKSNEIFIGGSFDDPWVIVLNCPCGCGDQIFLNTLEKEHPYWRLHIQDNSLISVSPSVWRTRGCKSHFFIRRNQIIWANDED